MLEAGIKRDGQGPERVGGKGRAGRCVVCHGKVKGGGDRHAKTKCSIRGIFGDHRKDRKLAKKAMKRKLRQQKIQRGAPVAGLNKGKRGSRPGTKSASVTK